MRKPDRSSPEPWVVRETKVDLAQLGRSESIFALSNGHIGWRANLDEGEPHAISGSYLNAVYEEVPLPYAEETFGYPEAGQAIVNVTNGKIIRLLVDDEPFDIRYGDLISHERVLDLKAGVLTRTVDWESPTHRRVRVRSTRLVSLVHRAVAAIRYEVEPVGSTVDLVLQSELVANEPVLGKDEADPRSGTLIEHPLEAEFSATSERGAVLIHSTRHSKLRIAAAMDHIARGPRGTETRTEAHPDDARFTVTSKLTPGQRLTLVKFVAYGWSSVRTVPALRSRGDGALASVSERPRLEWGRLPMADHSRGGMLRLLAGVHGRLSHQRRYRRRGAPLHVSHRRCRFRAEVRSRAAGRDRTPLGVGGSSRPGRRVSHRRRDGSG